jgi:hypothetical protein
VGSGLIVIYVEIRVTPVTTYVHVHVPVKTQKASHARLLIYYEEDDVIEVEVMTSCDVIKVMTLSPENTTEIFR